jgi:choloylglycine hydrolase
MIGLSKSYCYFNLVDTGRDPTGRKKISGATFKSRPGSVPVSVSGDMSSPSRFVRAFVYAHAAPMEKTSDQSVATAFHLLNSFDIAPGTIRTEAGSKAGGGVAAIEMTQWMAVSDLKNLRFYIRTYDGYDTQAIDLKAAKLDAPGIVFLPLNKPGAPKNVTPLH